MATALFNKSTQGMVSLRNSIWDQTWNKTAYSKKWLLWPHESWVFWEFVLAGFVSFYLFKLLIYKDSSFWKHFHLAVAKKEGWHTYLAGMCPLPGKKPRYMKWGKTTHTPWYSDSYWSRKYLPRTAICS